MTDVNYTPEFDPVDVDGDYGSTGGDITVPTFHDIKPFRFWCQKALPLVYDDSLSYYEVLCKVVSYLNNMMTDLTTGTGAITQFAQQFVINQQFLNNMAEKLGENTEELEDYINDRMDDFTTAYNELQDYVNQYFNNLDVQDEIDTKLDEMAESGQFNVLFDPVIQAWMEEETEYINTSIATQNSTLAQQNGRISVLEGRMDTFASLPSGSTSGNAELLDIRTNFLGETFGSAGDAVRASDFLASGFSSQPFEEEILTINVSSFGFFDVSAYKGGKYAIILNSYTDSLTETGQLYINSSASTTNATRLYDDTDETSGHEHVSDYINDYIETVTETFTQGYRILVTFSIPSDAEFTYIGLKYYKDLTGAIEPDYIGYATNWISIPVDPTLSIAGDSADAKATGDALNELNERFDTELNGIITGDEFNFALDTTWSQGGVSQEGEYSSWSRIRTDYIELDGIGQLTQIPASGYASCCVIYDSNHQLLRYTLWSTQSVTVSFADNEKYIRFNLRKDPEANLSPSAGVNLTAKAVYNLPTDVTGNSNAIKQMKSFAVNDLIWELGGVSSGANFSSTTRIRSQFLDVSNYGRLTATAETGYKYVINVFDKSKNYLFMIPAGGFVTGENIIEADDNIGYIKVMFASENDDTLSDTSISSNFSLKADWKATGEIKNIANNDDNLLDGVTWVRGVLDNDGEFVSSTSRAVTDDYINVSGLKSLRFHPLILTVWYAVFFYGNDGVISKSGKLIGDTEISVPSNSTKIKILISNDPDTWLNDATIGNTLKMYKGTVYDYSNNGNILIDDYFCSTCVNKKEIPNLASGTNILAFGDSITAEQTSAGWVYHFAAMTGCTVVDKAVGGSTFGHTETDSGHWVSTQIANTSDATWADADLVIVAGGTNDYGHEEPLDGIKDYVQDAIDAIRAKTNVPIVFITPIRRGLSIYDDPMQKLPMISGIISNVALANQCNVICGFDIPIPTYNINGLIDDMTRDALHPIATGANVYARYIINALT